MNGIDNGKDYTDVNAKAIDKWVEDGWEWGVPISHEEYVNVKRGKWGVLLTPTKLVPKEWFSPYLTDGKLSGVDILGLASGGGQQMPVFAALDANCTVFDNSKRQLENERWVAEREGYSIDIIKGDMTKRLPFHDNSFDLIFHPVSNCYVEDVTHVWKECFRILRKNGVLLAGMDNGINYLVEEGNPLLIVNKLPYNPLKDEALYEKCIEGDGSVQFSHTMEEQIGGQLKAGLCLTDLYEDSDREGGLGEYYPQFIATRAVKP